MKGKLIKFCIFLTIFLFRNSTVYRIINNRDIVSHVPLCKFSLFDWNCQKNGYFNFYPYHHATEVWYRPKMDEMVDENDELTSGMYFNNL